VGIPAATLTVSAWVELRERLEWLVLVEICAGAHDDLGLLGEQLKAVEVEDREHLGRQCSCRHLDDSARLPITISQQYLDVKNNYDLYYYY